MPARRTTLLTATTATAAVAVTALLLARAPAAPTVLEVGAESQAALTTALTPEDVAVDAAGNLYVSDIAHDVVQRITPDGEVTTIAGTGEEGAPVEGPATASPLVQPSGVAVTPDGSSVYITDRVAEVVVEVDTATGTLAVVAGVHPDRLDEVEPGTPPKPGPATDSGLFGPTGIALDGTGDLYIADTYHGLVEKVTGDGQLSFAAGVPMTFGAPPGWRDAVPAEDVTMHLPSDVAVDGEGNLFIADTGNHVVTRVSPAGSVRVAAGNGDAGTPSAGGARWSALGAITGVAADANGDLYIADPTNHVVLKVDLTDVDLEDPWSTGELTVIAGTGQAGTPVAGPATESPLNGPSSVDVDDDGNVYIAATSNHQVLKVDPDGNLSVVAGSGAGSAVTVPIDDEDVRVVNLPATAKPGEAFIPVVEPVVGRFSDGRTSVRSETPGVCTVTEVSAELDPGTVAEEYQDIDFIDIETPGAPTVQRVDFVGEGECSLVPTVEEHELFDAVDGDPQLLTVADDVPDPNRPPVADDQVVSAPRRVPTAIQLTGTDADGDPLSFSVATAPAKGSVGCDPAGACTYTANRGAVGSDSFTFTASDGDATSDPAAVTITLVDPPAQHALALLIADIEALDLKPGDENVLLNPLDKVLRMLDGGRLATLCSEMDKFLEHLAKRAGKGRLTASAAAALAAEAGLIRAQLGCDLPRVARPLLDGLRGAVDALSLSPGNRNKLVTPLNHVASELARYEPGHACARLATFRGEAAKLATGRTPSLTAAQETDLATRAAPLAELLRCT